MANARIVVGQTGGQLEISESTGVTGTIGYGKIYASSVDGQLHYVDGTGADTTVGGVGTSGTSGTSGVSGTSGTSGISGTSGTSGLSGELVKDASLNLYTPGVTAGISGGVTDSVVIGKFSTSGHNSSVVLGSNITSERANTLHSESILANGQGVSKGHNIGSTGGTVTIDWDNSNIQKITLTSNITSLTLSNPIQGGVYSLIVEQGGVGNTITWPSGAIKWPGGTPPTLTSGATGDTDVISLIYDPAGGTGYLGNANLAFS